MQMASLAQLFNPIQRTEKSVIQYFWSGERKFYETKADLQNMFSWV
jgi:hypothetical protein